MRQVIRIVLCSILLYTLFGVDVHGQAISVTPEKPHAGDTVTITYHPERTGFAVPDGSTVYVVAERHYSGLVMDHAYAPLRTGPSGWTADMRVPDDAVFLTLSVTTLLARDEGAQQDVLLYGDDGEPLPGSLAASGAPAEELDLHPAYLPAYRDKWTKNLNVADKDSLKAVIAGDLRAAESIAGEDAPALWYVRAVGRIVSGDEEGSRAAVKEMARRFPADPLTAAAFDEYFLQVLKGGLFGPGYGEMRSFKREHVRRVLRDGTPVTPVARAWVAGAASDSTFALDVAERVCRAWMADQPENPLPYRVLAQAYLAHHADLDEAATLVAKSTDLYVEGKALLFGNDTYRRDLTYAYGDRAHIALARGAFGEALAAARAQQHIDVNDVFTVNGYTAEGDVWMALDNLPRAASAYLQAWRIQPMLGGTGIRDFYRRVHGDTTGFAAYLAAARAETEGDEGTAENDRQLAFHVTALDGETYDLDALRGKIVVLNFWFVDCAPCRVEIPDLNQLVHDYAGDDVVFLAFALDEAPYIRRFRRNNPFDYHLIPNARDVANQYGIRAYPTHVIIDRAGKVRYEHAGLNSGTIDALRAKLSDLLRASR